jgi:hypothetical protein
MPIIKRVRTGQWPLVAEFLFNYNDGMAPVPSLTGASVELNLKAGVTDFGSQVQPSGLLSGITYTANTNASTNYFEVISLPVNAQIISGEMQIEVPYVGPSTATLALGDVNSGALYLGATSLKATAFTNQPTAITNAVAGLPQQMTLTNATANGITAVGQTITISGCTGTSAAYNGTFIVDSFTATSVVVTNAALTASLTLAGTPAATFITGRVPLVIPGELTNQGGYAFTTQTGYDAAAGNDVRATMVMTGGQAATQGRVRIRFTYTIDGRANEVHNS